MATPGASARPGVKGGRLEWAIREVRLLYKQLCCHHAISRLSDFGGWRDYNPLSHNEKWDFAAGRSCESRTLRRSPFFPKPTKCEMSHDLNSESFEGVQFVSERIFDSGPSAPTPIDGAIHMVQTKAMS